MIDQTPYTIRTIRDDEREAASALTLEAYGQYSAQMTPSAWEALQNALIAALATPGAIAHLVAEQGGAIVGSVMLFPPKGGASSGGRMIWPELRLLAVTPNARGKGMGEALVRSCIERARASGAPAIGLYSSASLRTAIALYERLGFTRVPEHDFHPPGAEHVMAFWLPLDAVKR